MRATQDAASPQSGSQARSIRLKCRWKENEIRTVVLNPEHCDFLAIISRLSNDFGFPVSLKYQDIDGDMIILNTQNDFDDLVRTESAQTINVVVSADVRAGGGSKLEDNAEHCAAGAGGEVVKGGVDSGETIPKLRAPSSAQQNPSLQHRAAEANEAEAARAQNQPTAKIDTQFALLERPDADRVVKQVTIQDSDITSHRAVISSPMVITGIRKNPSRAMQPLVTSASDILDSPLTSPGNSFNNSLMMNTLQNAKTAESTAGAGATDSGSGSSRVRHSGSSKKHRQQSDSTVGTPAGPAQVGGNADGAGIRWKRGEMLGQGAFGVVYLGLNTTSGELMAVKQVTTDEVSSKELASLENEINLLRGLWHRNIVRYIGTEMHNGSLSIFLEYVPGGSLKALVDKFGKLEDSVAKTYTRQLLMGLEYLHTNGIAHRDVKGANCLVGNDGICKLADFGNSKHWRSPGGSPGHKDDAHGTNMSVQSVSGDIKGTPSWMAPEVIREQGSNHISWRKADVWSLACTTLEMVTGKPPWSQFSNSVTILYHIACQETLPEYPVDASAELNSFLSACLQRDPGKRPDTTSLLLHPFVASNIGGQVGSVGFNSSPTRDSRNKGFDSPGSLRHDLEGSGSYDRLGGGYASPSHRSNMRNGPPGWYSSHGSSVHRPHSVSTDVSNSHAASVVRSVSKPNAVLDGVTLHSASEKSAPLAPLSPSYPIPKIASKSSVQTIEVKQRELGTALSANEELVESIDSAGPTSSKGEPQTLISSALPQTTVRSTFHLVPGRSSIVPSDNVPRLAVLQKNMPDRSDLTTPPASHQNKRSEVHSAAAVQSEGEKVYIRKLSTSSGEKHDPERSHPRPDLATDAHKGAEDEELEELDDTPQLSRNTSNTEGNVDSSLDVSVDDSKSSKEDSGENQIHAIGNSSSLGPIRSAVKKTVVLNDVVIPQKRNGIMERTSPSTLAERARVAVFSVAEGYAPRGITIPGSAEFARSQSERSFQLQSPPGGLNEVVCPGSPRSPRSPRSGSLGSMGSFHTFDYASSEDQQRNRSDSYVSQMSMYSAEGERSQSSLWFPSDHTRPLSKIPSIERPKILQDSELDLSSVGLPISRIANLQNLVDTELGGGAAPMSPMSTEARLLKHNANQRLKRLNKARNTSASKLDSSADSFEGSVGSLPLTSPRTLQALRINDNRVDATEILSGDHPCSSQSLNTSISLNNLTSYNLASVAPDHLPPQVLDPVAMKRSASAGDESQSLVEPSNEPAPRVALGHLPRQSPITINRVDSHGHKSFSRDAIEAKAVRWGGTLHIEGTFGAAAAAADDASAGIINTNYEEDSLDSLRMERVGSIETRMTNNPGLRLVIPSALDNDRDLSPNVKLREQLGAPSPIAHRKKLDSAKNSSVVIFRANNSHSNGSGLNEQNIQEQWKAPPSNGSPSTSQYLSPSRNDPYSMQRPVHRKGPLSAHARMTENRRERERERERERGTGMLSGNINSPTNRPHESGMVSDDRELFHGAALQNMGRRQGMFDAVEPDSDAVVPGFSTAPALMSKRRQQQSGKTRIFNQRQADSSSISTEKEAAANQSINAYYQQIGKKSGMAAGAAKVASEEEQAAAGGGSYLPSPIRMSGGNQQNRNANGMLLGAGDASGSGIYSPRHPADDMSAPLSGSYGYPYNQPAGFIGRSNETGSPGEPSSGPPTKMSLGPSTANAKSVPGLQRKIANDESDDDLEEEESGDTYQSEIRGWERHQVLLEHKAAITRLRCPRGTDLLISSSLDGTVRIWSGDPNRDSSLAILDASAFNLPGGNTDHRSVGGGMIAAPNSDNINNSIQASIMNGTTIGGISEQNVGRVHVKITNVWAETNCASVWASCSDNALRVWSGAEGKPVRYLRGHEDSITCLEGMGVSSNVTDRKDRADYADADSGQSDFGSSLIATGSVDNSVRIWDARCKKAQIFLFKGHSDTVLAVRWGAGGRSVITAGKDKTIRIWDTRAGRLRTMIEKHFGSVTSLRAVPKHLGCSAIGGEAGNAAAGIANEAASFASGGRDSVVNLWTNNGNCVGSVSSHRQGVHYLSDINLFNFNASAKSTESAKGGKTTGRVMPTIFSIGGEGSIKIWDLKRFKAVGDINVYSADVRNSDSTKEISDGSKPPLTRGVWAHQSIVSSHGKEGSITMWSSDGSTGAWSSQNLAQHGSGCTDLLSTNSFVASASKTGSIFRWTPFNY